MHRASVSYRPITAHLRRGDLIAYPTESSYGPGCDPDNRDAVLRLLKLKHRPQHESLILIASSYQQVARCPQPLTSTQQQQPLVRARGVGVTGACRHAQTTFHDPRMGVWHNHTPLNLLENT